MPEFDDYSALDNLNPMEALNYNAPANPGSVLGGISSGSSSSWFDDIKSGAGDFLRGTKASDVLGTAAAYFNSRTPAGPASRNAAGLNVGVQHTVGMDKRLIIGGALLAALVVAVLVFRRK